MAGKDRGAPAAASMETGLEAAAGTDAGLPGGGPGAPLGAQPGVQPGGQAGAQDIGGQAGQGVNREDASAGPAASDALAQAPAGVGAMPEARALPRPAALAPHSPPAADASPGSNGVPKVETCLPAAGGSVATPAGPAPAPAEQAACATRMPMRLRAALDVLVVLAATSLPLSLVPDPYEALLLALVIASVAIVWFVARRERDLARHAAVGRWRADAVKGRGIPLADWHAGAPLPPWSARRTRA